ncbi:Hypothetical protein AJAP_12060 [Amycolatopsis japonica]|uniref:Uncharacterized protein n=1 Tax=Amycolatopsis japonica TaxID=208439 RepID=A0A075US13_9PSEU|nr:hypothetical protein [Amycolatopsis japonica]AIG75294.1 Hypothetical protein AJAP_12060 [Amycolatopsis japonica]
MSLPKAHLPGKGASCPSHGGGGSPFEPGQVRGTHASTGGVGVPTPSAVLFGPHSHINGATIEDEVFVATGASLFSPDRHDELWEQQRTLEFPEVVYGVPRETTMREIMTRQTRFYGAHQDDRILEDRPDDDA